MRIALMGYARTGKDTVATILTKKSGLKAFRLGFGDELKKNFHDTFRDIPASPKPREGYNLYGQSMRSIDPEIWIKHLHYQYLKLKGLGVEDFIITDVRQPNEADWCKRNDFVLVEVRATDYIREERSEGDSSWQPVSPAEKHMKEIYPDWIIYNNGTLEDLVKKVTDLYNIIEGENIK